MPKRPPAEPADFPTDFDEGWVWIGDQRMFVVGYTPGGAPYGWIDDSVGASRSLMNTAYPHPCKPRRQPPLDLHAVLTYREHGASERATPYRM